MKKYNAETLHLRQDITTAKEALAEMIATLEELEENLELEKPVTVNNVIYGIPFGVTK